MALPQLSELSEILVLPPLDMRREKRLADALDAMQHLEKTLRRFVAQLSSRLKVFEDAYRNGIWFESPSPELSDYTNSIIGTMRAQAQQIQSLSEDAKRQEDSLLNSGGLGSGQRRFVRKNALSVNSAFAEAIALLRQAADEIEAAFATYVATREGNQDDYSVSLEYSKSPPDPWPPE